MSLKFPSVSVKKLTLFLVVMATLASLAIAYEVNRIRQIYAFNRAVSTGKNPQTDKQSFEAKYATAYLQGF